MAEAPQLTDHQRAAMVARFVELQEVSMVSVDAKLLTPKANIISSEVLTFSQEKNSSYCFDEDKKIICVIVDLTTEISGTEKGEPIKLVRCAGSYALIYSFNATGGPPHDERDAFFSAFANINAVFNAWPFFRELVHSTLGRMGLQPLSLPVYRIAPPSQPASEQRNTT